MRGLLERFRIGITAAVDDRAGEISACHAMECSVPARVTYGGVLEALVRASPFAWYSGVPELSKWGPCQRHRIDLGNVAQSKIRGILSEHGR